MRKTITVLGGAALLALPTLLSGAAMGKNTNENSWIVAQATNNYGGSNASADQDSSANAMESTTSSRSSGTMKHHKKNSGVSTESYQQNNESQDSQSGYRAKPRDQEMDRGAGVNANTPAGHVGAGVSGGADASGTSGGSGR